MFIIILKLNTYNIISMSSAINSTEDILEKRYSTDFLLLPFLMLQILNLKFTIGHFADNHIYFLLSIFDQLFVSDVLMYKYLWQLLRLYCNSCLLCFAKNIFLFYFKNKNCINQQDNAVFCSHIDTLHEWVLWKNLNKYNHIH